MKLILEVNGKFKEHIFISEEGVTIGRSWDNDVILKDRYVDPKQAKLSLTDNELIIEDLDSTNGTEVSGQRVNGKGVVYQIGSLISIGDTIIRLLNVTAEVAKTKRRSSWFHFVRFFKPLPLLVALLIATAGLYVFSGWMFSTKPYLLANAAKVFFESVSAIFLIAVCFAILNRLFKGKSSFKEHLIVISFVFIYRELAGFVVDIIRFNLQQNSTGELLAIASQGFVTALFIVGGLSYITQLNKLSIWLIAILCSASIIYSDYSAEFSKQSHQRWSAYSDTEISVLPSAYLFRGATDIESYFKETELLFDQADQAE